MNKIQGYHNKNEQIKSDPFRKQNLFTRGNNNYNIFKSVICHCP